MIIINYYYATWCGYCNKFKPTWEYCKKLFNNNPNVVYREYESKDRKQIEKDDIKGFPTLKFRVVRGNKMSSLRDFQLTFERTDENQKVFDVDVNKLHALIEKYSK